MERIAPDRKMFDATGIFLTSLFTLIFVVTNLIMIDYLSLRTIIQGQELFMVLMLSAILAYLYKNSVIERPLSTMKITFFALWFLYALSMFISMIAAHHFVLLEALILIMIILVFVFRMRKELLVYLITAVILSTPSLLLAESTLNESGSTLVLIFAAGFLIMPKLSNWVLLYGLITFALLLTITTSRTAILTFLIIFFIHLGFIYLYQTLKQQKLIFISVVTAGLIAVLIFFFRPLYQYFTDGSVGRAGIDWNLLTSTRYELWVIVFHNRKWLGDGHDYFNFTDLLHAHNILFDTLGRYGIVTGILFVCLLLFTLVAAARSIKTLSSAVFILAFIIIGMFEYNWLFMFTYFSPIVLYLVISSYMLKEKWIEPPE